MDKEQVRRAILNTLTDWCEDPPSRKVQDAMIVRILKLDRPPNKPPTVTRKAILDWRDETWNELRNDFNSDADAEVNQMFLATQMAEFLTAQGVNVEDE